MSETEIWSGERLAVEMSNLELKQKTLARLTGASATVLSWWMNDLRPPNPERARRVQRTVEGLKILRERGIENVNVRIPLLRRKLRELGGSKPTPVPQQLWSIENLAAWSARNELTLDETVEKICTFARRVLRVGFLSAPAQRFGRARCAAAEVILDGRGFGEWAREFSSRGEALDALSAKITAALVGEVGEAQYLHYRNALILTGEHREAPADADTN